MEMTWKIPALRNQLYSSDALHQYCNSDKANNVETSNDLYVGSLDQSTEKVGIILRNTLKQEKLPA